MRIPASTNLPDLQQAFRDLWQAIGPLLGDGGQNLDLHGRRITNAGDAVDPRDYVTKQQTGAPGSSAAPLVVDVATIRQTLNVLNQLRFRNAILISP